MKFARPRFFRSDRRPIFLEARSSTWFITITVSTGIFTDIFLYAVIVPVFPFSLVDRMGVDEANVQHWLSVLLAVYGAALLVGAPICGILADKIKYRKWPLLAGLFTVAAATLLLCLAPSLPLLILGRILQGLSGSVIWVVGLALLVDTVGGDGLATAMGYVGIAYSLATLVAPMLGGIVYDKSGYYAVFAMTFGVIALDIFLRLTMIEKKAAQRWLADDQAHVQNESTNSPPETNQNLPDGEAKPHVVSDKQPVESPSTNISESVVEAKVKGKMPAIITLWKSRRMLAAFWGNLVIASLVSGLDTTLTLFVSRTFEWNSLAAGILFLAPLLPSFFGPIIGAWIDKYGSRWFVGSGMILTAPFLVLLRLVDHNTLGQKVLLAALLFLVGVGIALALTGLMAEFGKVCADKERVSPGMFGPGGAYAQAYGILNISWASGSVIGAFWSGGIYNTAGWGTLTWTWALLLGTSALPILLFTDGWIGNGGTSQLLRKSRRQEVTQEVESSH